MAGLFLQGDPGETTAGQASASCCTGDFTWTSADRSDLLTIKEAVNEEEMTS